MKPLRIKFIAFVPILMLCSCLSEDPKGQIKEDEAYASAKDISRDLVGTLYNYIGGNSDSQGLQGTFRGVYDWNSMTTDEQMLPTRGGDWYDGGFWQRLYYHTWDSSDDALYSTWCYLYKVVQLTNRSLYLIDKHRSVLTDTQYAQFTSEVRALRALFYFELMDMYGRVPLVTEYSETPQPSAQSERSKVFDFIVSELQEALPHLPEGRSNYEGEYYGRITQPVACFLLAKLALNAAVYSDDDWTDSSQPQGSNIYFTVGGKRLNAWQTTIYYCERISTMGYTLEARQADNFIIHNETSKENIFVIPMNKVLYSNIFGYLFRSRHYAHGSALGLDSENGTSATLSTVHAFGYGTDSLDTRYATTFFSDTIRVNGKIVLTGTGDPLVYYPLEIRPDLTGSKYEKVAGARMSKYEVDPTAYSDGKLQDNDIVLFRYADVLLMEAEAKVRDGQDGTAELNKVRTRAGMPPRGKASLDNILKERLLELMWEGWRRNDLIRFDLFHRAYDFRPQQAGEADRHTTVFPIPQSAIDMNGKLKQNKGYESKAY